MFKYLLLLLIPVLLSVGCSNRLPPPSLEETLAYDVKLRNHYVKDENWWQTYNCPQLNKLVAMALADNIDYAKTAIAVNRALYQAKLIGADLLPTFSATTSGGVAKQTNTGASHVRNYSAEGQVNYELDLWRKLADSVSAKEWEFKATQLDRDAAKLVLIDKIVDNYFSLCFLDGAIKATEESIRNYERIRNIIFVRHSVGKVDALEKELSYQAVLSAKNALLDYQLQRTEAEQTLRLLLNMAPDSPLELHFPDLVAVKNASINLNVPMFVLVERPDLRAAEYRLRGAFRELKASEKAWLPGISLRAIFSANSEHFDKTFNAPLASGLLSFSLPFLDWNRVRWNVKISEADYDDLLLNYHSILTIALNEVSSAWSVYRINAQRSSNWEQKYAHDRNVSAYYQKRYDLGTGELADWLNALNTELSSRLSLLESRYAVIASENMIYKAMAGRFSERL